MVYEIAYSIAVIFNMVALYFAVQSGGLGHGDYRYAIMFFPLECILMVFITPLGIALAFVHYPLLVFLFQCTKERATRIAYLVFMGVAHSIGPIYMLMGHPHF
jgi:hypothetical protein